MKRNFFNECIEHEIFKEFNLLEIDFRINVLAQNIKKNFEILEESLNVYRITDNSLMSKNKKFSPIWWKKRLQAHKFMKTTYFKFGQNYGNIDFSITKFFVNFLNFLKL
tara:strand:- start:364 stop:690 length:327 start_codon:yes stop_codon:yes gene_type:complete